MNAWSDDELFDLVDEGLPPGSPEEAAARKPYEHLVACIRDLEYLSPPPGWEERAQASLDRARRDEARRHVLAAFLSVVAALAAGFVGDLVATLAPNMAALYGSIAFLVVAGALLWIVARGCQCNDRWPTLIGVVTSTLVLGGLLALWT